MLPHKPQINLVLLLKLLTLTENKCVNINIQVSRLVVLGCLVPIYYVVCKYNRLNEFPVLNELSLNVVQIQMIDLLF